MQLERDAFVSSLARFTLLLTSAGGVVAMPSTTITNSVVGGSISNLSTHNSSSQSTVDSGFSSTSPRSQKFGENDYASARRPRSEMTPLASYGPPAHVSC
ncbi:unnamed protein product [Protopolystoma xenopodis]|uniref:Uncharacterized protein n=1 Tax=Protopolystoma xenopodis TaxID=117903 RepID=A0A3S5B3V7_9PLAT|nr:unnamed protein product [Protopolystoma xenopodis]